MKSMTGYGRGEAVVHGRSITVELRSVNNRYLDCTIKLPRIYVFAEDAIKSKVQAHISRGKVDVFVTIGPSENEDVSISVNKPVADGYYAALCALREQLRQGRHSVSLLSRFQDVFLVEKTQEDLEAVSADICSVLELALQDFDAMRAREGEKLFQDVTGRARTIEALTTRVEERAPGIVADYRARLSAKMAKVLQNTQLDESRILTEAAVYADKVAVDEETVRLRSHLSQLDHMLAQEGPVGRKLDFLIQEFNREANTIGSNAMILRPPDTWWISRPRSKIQEQIRTSSKAVGQDKAYQYRIWKHGFAVRLIAIVSPGVSPIKRMVRGPGDGVSLIPPMGSAPGSAHHGQRPHRSLGPTARDSGRAAGRPGEQPAPERGG